MTSVTAKLASVTKLRTAMALWIPNAYFVVSCMKKVALKMCTTYIAIIVNSQATRSTRIPVKSLFRSLTKNEMKGMIKYLTVPKDAAYECMLSR